MSDFQKQQRSTATPIKNPLLSASVTGLTFDDFPNKPLLLPAAPPVVHAAIPAPIVTSVSLISREPKSLVTVGSSLLDTENLDEINLNASHEENQSSNTSDANANPLLDPPNQGSSSDSILSQAASSFSALPSVASNVFSTFSKRITAISSRETTPIYEDSNATTLVTPKLDIKTNYTQQQLSNQGDLFQGALPHSGNYFESQQSEVSSQVDTQNNLPAPEPPKFYTPSDVPPVPVISATPPANLSGQNNFRFSSKKKLYAPIPGLSDQSQKPTAILESSDIVGPISYDNSYGSNYPSSNLYQQPQLALEDKKQEEHKVGSGLFSKITNLAPTGVLQNITGLVQSATGSLTYSTKPDTFQQHNTTQTSYPVFESQTSFSRGPPQSGQQTNFQNILSSTDYTNTSQNLKPPPLTTYDNNTSTLQQSIQEIEEKRNQSSTLEPACVLFQNEPSLTTEILTTNFPFFNPLSLPNQTTTSQLSSPTSQSSSSQQGLRTGTNTVVPQVELLDPKKFLPPSNSDPNSQINSSALPLSSTADHTIPPKATGFTSYRLQKGTKLYKNPLTPQETAPIQVTPNQIQNINQTVHPPFSTQQNFVQPQSVTLFPPLPTGEQKPNDHTQGVPLFASPTDTGDNLIQGIPLFVSLTTKQSPNDQKQSVAQFVPPSTGEEKLNSHIQGSPVFTSAVGEQKENQSVSLFAPPLEEQKTKDNITQSLSGEEQNTIEFIQSVPLLTSSVEEQKSNESQSNATTQSVPLFSVPIEEKQSQEFTINELGHNIPIVNLITETKSEHSEFQKTSFLDITDNQLVVEAIEPVVEKDTETLTLKPTEDFLEQTIQELSLSSKPSLENKSLTLPSISTQDHTIDNPYRRGSATENSKSAVAQPTLANFFEPPSGSVDLNFFATLPGAESPHQSNSKSGVNFFSETTESKEISQQITELAKTSHAETINFFTNSNSKTTDLKPIQPNITAVYPPITVFFPKFTNNCENKDNTNNQLVESVQQKNIPPPIGFENFFQPEPTAPVDTDNTTVQQEKNIVVQKTTNRTQRPKVVNKFSNYFNQTQTKNHLETVEDSSTFFDLFSGQTSQKQQQEVEANVQSVTTNEEQRIQHFFNNPPPKDANAVGDLNYDLIHCGLGIKNLQQRSLTSISNIVEPSSSACSEFSELSNPTIGQKSTVAINPLITDNSEKLISNDNTGGIFEEKTPSEAVGSNLKPNEDLLSEEILEELRMANLISANPVASVSYKPAVKHWFFKRTVNDKQIWFPFSHYDSALLETNLLMESEDKPNIVAVEGGRYDVNISERKKISVYWESEPIEVRRCSWFYKAIDSKYVPYEEDTAELLENEYKQAAESGIWHKNVVLGMGEHVVFHGPTVIVHFQHQQNADAWGGTAQNATRPRVVKRELDDFNIEQGESQKVDHLLFMVHGIGSACDLKLRSVAEVVEDFRAIARQLVSSHYKNSTDLGLVGRVEVLPISWHSHLHSVEMGIDEKLRMITLESIPKLRNFTNDTLLDILFYTSPTYCQKIMNTIVSSMNSLYLKYRERHPEFNGGVSLAGHSLGSLILFDLLCHQNPIKESEDKNPNKFVSADNSSSQMDTNQLEDEQISYTMGPAGTGQPFINYGQLIFQPKKFFALGSPIGMFVTIRGIDKLGLDFRLPTCPGFYNIFHPYDPVAYRIEALVNPDLSGIRPVLIPHHKGRKRMHLELKETMARLGMDLKNRFFDTFRTTWGSVNIFNTSKSTKDDEEMMEKEVDKVLRMEMELEQQNQSDQLNNKLLSVNDIQNGTTATNRQRTDSASTSVSDDVVEIDFPLGKLNDSKRIDYVLQEAPLEFINEYIFALSSHVCYWDSEDTILFVMKEIYSGLGISSDSQVPQQTMTIERPSSNNSFLSSS